MDITCFQKMTIFPWAPARLDPHDCDFYKYKYQQFYMWKQKNFQAHHMTIDYDCECSENKDNA